MLAAMSLAELKSEIDRLPPADVHYLAAYLKHRAQRAEPGYTQTLDRTWDAMQRGEKVRLDRALQLSAELRQSGA